MTRPVYHEDDGTSLTLYAEIWSPDTLELQIIEPSVALAAIILTVEQVESLREDLDQWLKLRRDER